MAGGQTRPWHKDFLEDSRNFERYSRRLRKLTVHGTRNLDCSDAASAIMNTCPQLQAR
jgi:phage tail tape-measure protein